MSKENNVNGNTNNNGEEQKPKLTLKERIKKIPFKKVLKVAGIIGGSVAGTIVLGKVMGPKEAYYPEYDDTPFDGGCGEVPPEETKPEA